jgi:hypothetical protein
MISSKNKKKILSKIEIDKISEESINEAEKILKTKFHPDYKWIIQHFGFLDDGKTVVSGLGADDQFENVVWLNNAILKDYKKQLKPNFIAISYQNEYDKILVMDQQTGRISSCDYRLNGCAPLLESIDSLLEKIY